MLYSDFCLLFLLGLILSLQQNSPLSKSTKAKKCFIGRIGFYESLPELQNLLNISANRALGAYCVLLCAAVLKGFSGFPISGEQVVPFHNPHTQLMLPDTALVSPRRQKLVSV